MCSNSSSLRIRFRNRLSPDQYASAVLACQLALMMVGLSEQGTVLPDGTATDDQINDVSDKWLASSPWSG